MSSTTSTFASFDLAIAALLETFASVTAPSSNLIVVTVPSLGVPILTEDPIVIIKNGALRAGGAANIISAPSIANPSLGLVPLLGF